MATLAQLLEKARKTSETYGGADLTGVDDGNDLDMSERGYASMLQPWANGGAGLGFSANDEDPAVARQKAQYLKQALRYDPNAQFSDATGQLEFDASKLPQFADGQKLSHNDIASFTENNAGGRLIDPTKVIHDDAYGDWTSRSNLEQAEGDKAGGGIMGQMQKYMPAVVSSIMAAGMGAAAGPMLGAVMSGTLGPGGIGEKLTTGQDVDWGKTGLNMGIGALGGLASGAGSMLPGDLSGILNKISPYASLGKSIYGARKGNIGSGVGAGMTLAKILQGAMNGGA